MSQFLAPAHRLLRLAVVLTLAHVCAALPGFVAAQGEVNAATRLLVMIEDEDPGSVVRSSRMAQGAIQELQQELERSGFRVITEESVASSLGWEVAKRSSKRKLIEAIEQMGSGGDASVQVDAGVLVRILASMRQSSRGTMVSVILGFEVYAATPGVLLTAYDVPPEDFPIRNDCASSVQCVKEEVGNRAREIAGSQAVVLARTLAQYAPPR